MPKGLFLRHPTFRCALEAAISAINLVALWNVPEGQAQLHRLLQDDRLKICSKGCNWECNRYIHMQRAMRFFQLCKAFPGLILLDVQNKRFTAIQQQLVPSISFSPMAMPPHQPLLCHLAWWSVEKKGALAEMDLDVGRIFTDGPQLKNKKRPR